MSRVSAAERTRLSVFLARGLLRKLVARVMAHPLLRWPFPGKTDRLVIAPQDLRTPVLPRIDSRPSTISIPSPGSFGTFHDTPSTQSFLWSGVEKSYLSRTFVPSSPMTAPWKNVSKATSPAGGGSPASATRDLARSMAHRKPVPQRSSHVFGNPKPTSSDHGSPPPRARNHRFDGLRCGGVRGRFPRPGKDTRSQERRSCDGRRALGRETPPRPPRRALG